jgi:hypothetical protein
LKSIIDKLNQEEQEKKDESGKIINPPPSEVSIENNQKLYKQNMPLKQKNFNINV